jgi:LmbE family N-acetylglucosaminyl deacetylase
MGTRYGRRVPDVDDVPDAIDVLPEDWERGLCVVAHPDDMEYGGAMAVAKWTRQGKQIAYVLATAGEAGIDGLPPDRCGPLREAEERAAARAVGAAGVEFLGYTDGCVEYGLPLRRDLARALRRHRPEVVVTAHFGLAWGATTGGAANQADHRHVGLATLDACRDAGNRWIFPELTEEGHEAWSGVRLVAVAGSPTPTHGVEATDADVDAGVASLEAHAAYLAALGGDFEARTFVRDLCAEAGRQLGVPWATSFECYTI